MGEIMIKHANIFYVRNIHAIGGVETFVYELAKKYKCYDNGIVCKTIDNEQKKRLKKYCPVYVHKNEPIECDVIITNWDTSIYDYVNKDAKKYTVLHTDYSNPTEILGLPKDREDITYIGITEDSKNKFEKITGIKRTILCRNPLEIEEDESTLILVSATRLTKIKDNGRHLKLAESLERQKIKFIWYIFTTDEYKDNPIWENKNVIKMQNRLDLGQFMKNADWYVQLSSCEGDSYSLKEALYRGTPIVVCELPYFKEIGIKNGENALYYNLDNSNADEVAKKMKMPLKFEFKKVKDGYDELLNKTKSHYEEDLEMKVKVEAVRNYFDVEEKEQKYAILPKNAKETQHIWVTSKERADELLKVTPAIIKILEEVKTNKEVFTISEEDMTPKQKESFEKVKKKKK